MVCRFAVPTICFLALMFLAVLVLLDQASAMYWMVPVMILLIVEASLNAWDLLIRFRKPVKGS